MLFDEAELEKFGVFLISDLGVNPFSGSLHSVTVREFVHVLLCRNRSAVLF